MKRDLSAVHPELRTAARLIPRLSFNRFFLTLYPLATFFMRLRFTPRDMHIENVRIPGPGGRTNLRLRIYRPRSVGANTPALLWMHGGGLVFGLPEQDEASCIHYARECGLTVVSVDYRCAPRHPFPAALDDCGTALQWLSANAVRLGVDASRIAVGGGSAGGGLAASLAQLALDQGEVKPTFQLLVYPMLDDRTSIRPGVSEQVQLGWTQENNRFGWSAYLGQPCGAPDLPPYAVPARRADLRGLPPAWIGVGTLDLFHEEDLAYAQRLNECGVQCEVSIMPGAFHGFDVVEMGAQMVKDFKDDQIKALKKYLF